METTHWQGRIGCDCTTVVLALANLLVRIRPDDVRDCLGLRQLAKYPIPRLMKSANPE